MAVAQTADIRGQTFAKGREFANDSQRAGGKAKPEPTCVPPLVPLQLVGARKTLATVGEVTLVRLLAWTTTPKTTTIRQELLREAFLPSWLALNWLNRPAFVPNAHF